MKSISDFKRGFGGRLYLQCSGEYFFTEEYLDKTYVGRLQGYKQARWGQAMLESMGEQASAQIAPAQEQKEE